MVEAAGSMGAFGASPSAGHVDRGNTAFSGGFDLTSGGSAAQDMNALAANLESLRQRDPEGAARAIAGLEAAMTPVERGQFAAALDNARTPEQVTANNNNALAAPDSGQLALDPGQMALANTVGNLLADGVASKPETMAERLERQDHKLLGQFADSGAIRSDAPSPEEQAWYEEAANEIVVTAERIGEKGRSLCDKIDHFFGTNLFGHNPHDRSRKSDNIVVTYNAIRSGASYAYNGTIGPNTIFGRYIVKPVDDAFYGAMGAIANSPLGDPGTIMTLESSGIGSLPGGALAGIRGLAVLGGTVRAARAVEGIS
ncbi:MAG: hypothetical protein P8Y48_18655, partial [Novosphingobium sp.]